MLMALYGKGSQTKGAGYLLHSAPGHVTDGVPSCT